MLENKIRYFDSKMVLIMVLKMILTEVILFCCQNLKMLEEILSLKRDINEIEILKTHEILC